MHVYNTDTVYELNSGQKKSDIFTFTIPIHLINILNKLKTSYDWLKNPSSLVLKISFWVVTADGLYLDFYLFLFYA